MRKPCSVAIAVLQCAVLSGLVVIVSNPETSLAQTSIPTSDRVTSYALTEIKFPGAIRTGTIALNDRGDIVGDYFDSSLIRHGFLLKQGTFTTIDLPNSTFTEATAINNAGVVSGYFSDSNNVVHGYLLYRGVFTIYDFPGATATFAGAVNDELQVVGIYLDGSSNEHGYLLNHGTFTSIDYPGDVAGTEAIGINNRGEIVGDFIGQGISALWMFQRRSTRNVPD